MSRGELAFHPKSNLYFILTTLISELPGGGVALPGLVGKLGLEADEGGLGALVGLGCD